MYKEVIKIIELATSYYVKGYKPTKENSPTSDQQDCLSKTILKVQSIFSSSQNIILGYFFNPKTFAQNPHCLLKYSFDLLSTSDEQFFQRDLKSKAL